MALTFDRKCMDRVYVNNYAALPILNSVVLTHNHVAMSI